MKTTTSITIDADLLQKAKILKINISNLVNNVLKGVLVTGGDYDIFDIEKKLDQYEKELMVIKNKQNELLAQKIAFQEKKKQGQNKDLKEQIKMAEAIKRSGIIK